MKRVLSLYFGPMSYDRPVIEDIIFGLYYKIMKSYSEGFLSHGQKRKNIYFMVRHWILKGK